MANWIPNDAAFSPDNNAIFRVVAVTDEGEPLAFNRSNVIKPNASDRWERCGFFVWSWFRGWRVITSKTKPLCDEHLRPRPWARCVRCGLPPDPSMPGKPETY